MNIFVWKLSKIAAQKKSFFFTFFRLLRFSVFFNGLFAPTSRSGMSNIFRDSESLRQSNRRKWSNIWTFLFGSGLKSPRNFIYFFCWVCLGPPSNGIRATIRIGREMLCLPYAGFFIYEFEWRKKNFYVFLATYHLNISWCCKAQKGTLSKPVSVSKNQWVDENVNNFLPIKASELRLCVCYLRGKSAPLTNFQPKGQHRKRLIA